MEFFVEESHAADLLQQIKARDGAESALYKESALPGTSKKDLASRKQLTAAGNVNAKAVSHR